MTIIVLHFRPNL